MSTNDVPAADGENAVDACVPVIDVVSSEADLAVPPPSAAVGVLDRVEGRNASYFLFAFPDLSLLAYSIDQGLIGASDKDLGDMKGPTSSGSVNDDAARGTDGGTRRNIVIAVVAPGIALGYAIVLGAEQPRAALKEVIKKEMPREWCNVVRVGWVRVASVSAVELRSLLEQRGLYAPPSAAVVSRHGPFDGSSNVRIASLEPTDDAALAQKKRARVEDCVNACERLTFPATGVKQDERATGAQSLWISVGRDVGALLCHAIDETSMTVLPYDLRAVQCSAVRGNGGAIAPAAYRQRQEVAHGRAPLGGVHAKPPCGAQHATPPADAVLASHSAPQYSVEQYRAWLQLYYPHLSPQDMEACALQYYHAQFQQRLEQRPHPDNFTSSRVGPV